MKGQGTLPRYAKRFASFYLICSLTCGFLNSPFAVADDAASSEKSFAANLSSVFGSSEKPTGSSLIDTLGWAHLWDLATEGSSTPRGILVDLIMALFMYNIMVDGGLYRSIRDA
ncbi:MAG: hypothetical protein Q3962_04840 [Corynebacterium sp.]|nr:hypothetical protein [Corynebacterium sp.]